MIVLQCAPLISAPQPFQFLAQVLVFSFQFTYPACIRFQDKCMRGFPYDHLGPGRPNDYVFGELDPSQPSRSACGLVRNPFVVRVTDRISPSVFLSQPSVAEMPILD